MARAEQVFGRERVRAVESSRIIGGEKAPPGRWPFQVGLLKASVADNFTAQFCGGTLIDPYFVLTAAHCVDNIASPNALEILVGTQSLASGGQRYAVAQIKVHPSWNPRTFDFDVAVVRLAQPVHGVPLARLIDRDQEKRLAEVGDKGFVVGWGDTTASQSAVYPEELRQLKVPIVPRSVCNGPDSYNGQITGRMFCAGFAEGGKDACQGDSGGPLLVSNRQAGNYVFQAGIVSWGLGCAQRDLYGIYTRVAVVNAWIRGVMRGAVAPDQQLN